MRYVYKIVADARTIKKSLVAVILISTFLTVHSQPCLPEGITFSTQSQIDSFQINYPGCTEIEGDVDIVGDDIHNLNGLEVLSSVGGTFYIGSPSIGNPILVSLTGLKNLSTVYGDFKIFNNESLEDLMGLSGLINIDGNLVIVENAISSLSGLENLISIGESFYISNNNYLSNLSALNKLEYIKGTLSIYNCDSLTDLVGLETLSHIGSLSLYFTNLNNLNGLNISSVDGTVWIMYNEELTSLSGLDNLDTVGIAFQIIGNNSLPSLSGLNNLTCIESYFVIRENESLASLEGLGKLKTIGGWYGISQNFSLTNLDDLHNLSYVGESLSIKNNPLLENLTGLTNLKTVGGWLSLDSCSLISSLDGLDNIEAASIEDLRISNNLSLTTCNVASICKYLASPNGYTEIYNNALGCDSAQEVIEDCTLGISEKGNDVLVTIYPNPTSSDISFVGIEEIIEEISIYNKLGQRVIHKMKSENTINVSWLPPGLYIVEMVLDGHRVREKLIVQ